MDSKIGQDFPVEFDVQQMQSMDETAVGKAIIFGCRFDADDPKASKISFPGSSIPVGILESTFHRLFG
jgi:hypothetical protein